jgi:hypothetical protein
MDKMIEQAAQMLNGLPYGASYAVILVGGALLVAGVISLVRRASGRRGEIQVDQRAEPIVADPVSPPIAPQSVPPPSGTQRRALEIVESTSLNGFGGFCVFLMLLNWVIAGFMFLASSGAIQEAVAALVWIGGNTMFGMGAALNRQRKYRVTS